MRSSCKVALLIESSRAYGRGSLRGVAAYARSHGPWSIYQHERSLADAIPRWFEDWDGDGVIARVESKGLADKIKQLAIPTVELRGMYEIPNAPLIETNDLAVARMACDHLLEQGFRRIAYCGFANANYSERRKQFVVNYLAESNITPAIRDTPKISATDTSSIEGEGLLHEQDLGKWLIALDKPIGLIACNDIRAQQVLTACRDFEIQVPDEIAVIGVDNDVLICELTDPPLSSVENDTFQIGYLAAEQLDSMMKGRTPSLSRTLVNPIGVVARRSTEVLAIEDKEVAAAMRLIRDHTQSGISVNDIAKQLNLSRSTLDRRFAKTLGRSPKSEINRVLIKSVKQLLVDTDYKLPLVAEMAGFEYTEYMCTLFKEKTGVTPSEFRKRYQMRHNYGAD
jgi:LacI family transcriptional regulator